MASPITAHVDDATFQRNLKLYIDNTSKTVVDAVNFKLYDASREALKQTPKADKGTIKAKLNAVSSKYPERTVAEMIVVKEKQEAGIETFDLEEEVKALIGKRTSHIAFVKSGWLPAIKQLLSKVGKSFVTVSGVNKPSYGGADPARVAGSTIKGSAYNDVAGSGNKGLVEHIKEQGGQAAVDKVNGDIVQYLSKKLDKPIDAFNKS